MLSYNNELKQPNLFPHGIYIVFPTKELIYNECASNMLDK